MLFTKNAKFFANYGYIDASFDDNDSNGNAHRWQVIL
jgi:hypothetical protein